MLRRFTQDLNRRLLASSLLSRASLSEGLSSTPACVSGCRRLSAEPLADEDYAAAGPDEAAARQRNVQEQLVYELFGIREQVREQIKSRRFGPPKRIRRQDEPNLYSVPLKVLLDRMRGEAGGAEDQVLQAWERQVQLEGRALEATVDAYRKAVLKMLTRGEGPNVSAAQRMMVTWFGPLRNAIAAEQRALVLTPEYDMEDSRVGRRGYGSHLLLLDPEKLAVLTMHRMLSQLLFVRYLLSSRHEKNPWEEVKIAGQAKLIDVAYQLGKAVQGQVRLEQLRARVEEENAKRTLALQAWQAELRAAGSALDLRHGPQAAAAQPALLRDAEDSWRALRKGSDMPEDVRDWIESLDTLNIRDRLKAIRSKIDAEVRGWDPRARVRKVNRARKSLEESAFWATDDCVMVGTALVSLFLETANQPGLKRKVLPGLDPKAKLFWHASEYQMLRPREQTEGKSFMKKQGMVRCHDALLRELVSVDSIKSLLILHKYQPMLIPPLPWRSLDSGGYILTRGFLMRVGSNHLHRDALARAQNTAEGGLSQIYAALNVIGETGWRINGPVLEVVEAAQAARLQVGDLPPQDDQPLLRAAPPRRYMTRRAGGMLIAEVNRMETVQEQRAREAQNELRKKGNRELHSLRCALSLKLSVAQDFRHEPVMFFPHDLDFRGRAYPMHPHLNHMGPDICRGLLCFAEAKPLGLRGIDWLFVQIANSWGQRVDKLSFRERRHFAEQNLTNIIDSAERPLDRDATRWWQRAEDPWQTLAACMEVRDALTYGGPAADFPSRLPVQIDGSCNGLQHYAALGRDARGGAAVNLCPVEQPQDTYSEVAAVVAGIVAADAQRGVRAARALDGLIDRKLVKQTVMTSVYGVTSYGARDQIANRLVERGWVADRELKDIAAYAATITLQGLGRKFANATDIMEWLARCAQVVASHGHSVEWITPLGLPVIQPYRQKEEHIVTTMLQRLKLLRDSEKLPVQKARQRSAFPPNYIHSLDSSHMMLTALACKREGMAFAGVHDSFWTHAADVPVLNRLLREAFIELHSRPLLEELVEGLKRRFPDIDPAAFPPIPALGDLDIQQVKDAEYFFN